MSDPNEISIANLTGRMQAGWNALNAWLATLTDEQMTVPTDAAGWTVKDHLAHLAAWEDSVHAMFHKQSQRESLGVDEATWKSGDYDPMNEIIRRRWAHLTLAETRQRLAEVHERLFAYVQTLPDDALTLPHNHYQAESTSTDFFLWSIVGNTFGHYEEHLPWMQAIVDGASG